MELGPAVSPGPSRSFKEELLCAVCYDPFRDAVTLRCGHNFCRGCVTRCWEVQVAPTCPVCKDRAALADLRTNHTLNNLVEKLLREEAEGARWAGPRSPRLCRPHRGQFSLFCLDDKELLCCSCQADPRHQGHRVQPVKDTAHDFRVRAAAREAAERARGSRGGPGPPRPDPRGQDPQLPSEGSAQGAWGGGRKNVSRKCGSGLPDAPKTAPPASEGLRPRTLNALHASRVRHGRLEGDRCGPRPRILGLRTFRGVGIPDLARDAEP